MTKINVETFMKNLGARAPKDEEKAKIFFEGAEASLEIMIGVVKPPENYTELLLALDLVARGEAK